MHTCTCNDDNNILTHEFEVDQSIDITPSLIAKQRKKHYTKMTHKFFFPQILHYLSENKGSVPPYNKILSWCRNIQNILVSQLNMSRPREPAWIFSFFLHDACFEFLFKL